MEFVRIVAAKVMTRSVFVPLVFTLDVSLRGIRPRIWRCFAVPASIKLSRLHAVLQLAMGWTDSHLHEFTDGVGTRYGIPEHNDEEPPQDERKVRLDALIGERGDTLDYLYDFGDSWEHEIVLQSVAPAPKRPVKAEFIAGEGKCPPEDGGVPGYYEMLEALADKGHSEHERFKDWLIDGTFDPKGFDPVLTNLRLRSLRV